MRESQAPLNKEDMATDKFECVGKLLSSKGKSTAESLTDFCVNLTTLVAYVKNLKEIQEIYTYNEAAERNVDEEMKELEFTVGELKSLIGNIHRIKSKKFDLKKELGIMKGKVEKKKTEEIQEMELIVAIYDKDLLRKWHIAKKASSACALESFINNLAGKKQAMEYVYKMALERLNTIKTKQREAPIFDEFLVKPLPLPQGTEHTSL